MLPVIPIVAAAVSAVALVKTKLHEYLDVSSYRELSEIAKKLGVAVASDGRFDPNALVDDEPLMFYMMNRYQYHSSNYRQYFKALLSYGANPDICNSRGVPALIYALSKPDRDGIVSTLLQHGANPNAMDADGRTAVFFADSPAILSQLQKAGAAFNAVDAKGKPAFFYELSLARTLFFVNAAGVDVNTRDSEGKTIAFYISGPNDFILLQKLEANGLDINAKDNSENTFAYLDGYLCSKHRMLIKYNKSASKRLYEAVNDNDISGAIDALKDGADPDTRDVTVHGWNMIFLAIYKDNPR